MPAEYSFVSRWSIPADADRVWRETIRLVRRSSGAGVADPTGPRTTWWPGVRFEDAPASLEAGSTLRLAVRSPLGYRLRVRLTVDDVGPGRTLAASSAGDLRGRGRLSVEPDGDAASVVVFVAG
ncbi:hypothetical protein ACFC1W_09920 [Microbacterium sp. NPDC056003]|uniref:hypothetical protein n=1 Tax=Microbacterium sp. NPDC056003 TaxID=3345676 RepID=UPI0035E0D344